MKNLFIYLVIVGIMFQAGCAMVQTEHTESTIPFGSSVKLAVSQQTLNPEAGGTAPVMGLDGRYAASVANKHYEGPKTKSEKGQSVSEIIIGAK